MINLPNIDGKIWNIEQAAIKIVHSLQSTGSATISLNNEGGDCRSLGLYALLDNIVSTMGYSPNQIKIYTNNQLEYHEQYQIIKRAPLYVSNGQEFAKGFICPNKNWDNFKHFGIFIGRSSWQRLWLASHVWKHYKDLSVITYHYDNSHDHHRHKLSFDELAWQIGLNEAVKLCGEFMQQFPIINDEIKTYPILPPTNFDLSNQYQNFFVEIVCESFLSGNTFYPTEKTWRSIICHTPFIMLGPKNFLSNLKKLGFMTFDQWWDESYDEDADLDNGRIAIRNIQDTIDRLSTMNVNELEAMYIDMQPILSHNHETFLNLKPNDFKKIWP